MKRNLLLSLWAVAFLAFSAGAQAELPVLVGKPQVEIQTTLGSFVVELYPDKAPKSVANFLQYVDAGFYRGTIFHRTIKNFAVQGGGLTPDMLEKSTYTPIENESNNGLRNEPGTLAMARAFDPNSATSQFFINLNDNKFLNFYKPDAHYIGYAVFGRVIRGLDVVTRISEVATQPQGAHKNVPVEPVVIERATLLMEPIQPDIRTLPSSLGNDPKPAGGAAPKKIKPKAAKPPAGKPAPAAKPIKPVTKENTRG